VKPILIIPPKAYIKVPLKTSITVPQPGKGRGSAQKQN